MSPYNEISSLLQAMTQQFKTQNSAAAQDIRWKTLGVKNEEHKEHQVAVYSVES